jgi:uncharacterized protein
MKALLLAFVWIYRRLVSPVLTALTGPACRFEPTCSAYAQEAVRVHGAWRGARLAVHRLLRCHPFARAGFDPVPPASEAAADELHADAGARRLAAGERG